MSFDQHVKSILILSPIPMVDISRHIAMDGTLILVSFAQQLIFYISYPVPEQNTATKASLLEVFMFNFQSMGIGVTSSTTSITMLSIIEPRNSRLGSRQWPVVAGSQAI